MNKNIIIYAPTYSKSPGTRYKINMMKKTLQKDYNVKIVIDKREEIFRFLYAFISPILLNYAWSWNKIGKTIAKRIIDENPDIAIIVMDITAGAIPYLKEKGIKVILSVEDLSWEWLNIRNKKDFQSNFQRYANMSDLIITISESVQKKLSKLGIKAIVTPPGLEKIYVTYDEALNYFNSNISVLHAGKIQHTDEAYAFNIIANKLKEKYRLKAYLSGKYSKNFKNKLNWIDWYNFSTPYEAINYLKSCRIGLIIRYRANNPSRIYYHASMLQPIIAIGGEWTQEIKRYKIGIPVEPNNIHQAIDYISDDYYNYLYNIYKFAKSNLIDRIYAPLTNFIKNS